MNDAIEKLGSKIKALFDRKRIEDNQVKDLLEKNFNELNHLLEGVLEKVSETTAKEIREELKDLKKTLEEKNLEVNVETPSIVVPEPVIKVVKESKHALETKLILEKILEINLRLIKKTVEGIYIKNQSPQDAVSVVLTDASKKDFYNAVAGAIATTNNPPFITPQGVRRPANVDANGNLIVDVNIGDISVSLDKTTDSVAIWSNTAKDGSGTDLQWVLDANGYGSVKVQNFPSEYPLPAAQVAALTPPAAITGFATSAKQDTIIAGLASLDGKDFSTETTLAAILAKIIASPATESKQDDIITLLTSLSSEDFATQTTLQALYNLVLGIDFAMDSTLQDVLAALGPSGASTTGTSTSVNDSATNVTLLASNTSRKGASFYNDSTATLYLKCGATATTTSFTIVIAPRAYYELPFKYTGIIDGIWTSAAGGAARITEFT